MGFTACQKEIQEEVPVNEGTVQVTFVSGSPETKTTVDTPDGKPVFAWGENETFAVLEQTDDLAEASSVAYEKVDGKANITATFDANDGQESYNYVTVYPASGYVSAESLASATLSLPAVQTMAEGSYDPNADLMVSKVVTTSAQPTEAQMVSFTRMAAVVKMTLKNFTLESGDEVEQVIFTAEGKKIAGTVTADLDAPHKFTVAEGVDNVTVNTTSSSDVYFTVLPTTLEAGDAYTVTILTNKKLYIKQGTIPAKKSLVFEAGMVTRFGVNMAGVAASEKWVLVRDASTLAEGDIVTIAAVNNNFVLGCSSATNFPYASYTEPIKAGEYLYHPVITEKSKYQYMVQSLILAKQDADKAAFDFYNGVDYEGDTKTGYLTNAQTNNYLQLSQYPSRNSSFEISIKDGVATIDAAGSEWDNNLLKFFNSNPNSTTSSYRRFVCIDAASVEAAKHDDVCIYKLEGAKGVVPTAGAVVTVPDADEPVVVAMEGVAEETVFEGVKFTYVGDWNISVSDNAEWLTVNYADGALSYTAEANDGAVRNATVTITASHEGEETKTWTFNVVQKGAPVKVTVAEFLNVATKENVNPNVEYEVTGILEGKPSSASGTTYLVDAAGNEVKFKYVYMTGNTTALSANADINKGDVVTIVAAVSDVATGGSSSAHAICKGYYNLSSTVENDLVAYTGGSVEIALNKLGTLAPAGNITCTSDADFAELKYTVNADKATVTLPANDGAPRQVVVTFTDGYAETSATIVQGADPAKGNTWELVTDASTLEAGDQVIIAAKDYDVAMSTTISSECRSTVAVTKLGNHFLTPTADVQTLVLANGSAEGTFAFYDGVNKGFLVSTSTSYKLNNQTYIDANTSFTVSIADGVATIGNKAGNYSSNKIYYREGSSYNYFYSGTTAKQTVSLYRLVGVKGTIPVIPADVTVPASTAKVVIPEEGAAEATPVTGVVFNYVGDWNISATSEADWVTFAFDKTKNQLTYTAAANEGTVREASATITASLEGQEPLTWKFNVLQKGAPMEVSIAEFITKPIDTNITYRLTGKIVTIPSSATDYFVLADADGNEAKVRYLKTEEDQNVKGNVDILVGDVITVTTVVTTTQGCGGHSSNYSYYKGHYRLTAKADNDLIDYEGGTATITLATSGNLVPSGEIIKGEIVEGADFVTFDYTENAATATATFAANTGASRNAEFNFSFGLASASVTVGQLNDPSVKVGWFLVTDVNELAVGDKVIIAGKNPDGNLDYAIKKYASNTGNSTGIAISLLGNSINGVDGVEQFTLGSGHTDYDGTWSFVCDSYNRYLQTNSNNTKITSTLDKTSSWVIDIAADGKATLTSKTGTSSTSKNTMMFNYTTSNQTFGAYTSTTTGKGAIYIYKYYNE